MRRKDLPEITIRADYVQLQDKGKRVPGWEELNCTKLARALGCCAQIVREKLTGRRNITLGELGTVARKLGLGVGELVDRIERAMWADEKRKVKDQDRRDAKERRREALRKRGLIEEYRKIKRKDYGNYRNYRDDF